MEVRELAQWMCEVLDDVDNPEVQLRVRSQVMTMCERFPVYQTQP